jgi:hypothetical protein
MSDAMLTSFTLDVLRDALQQANYRVETAALPDGGAVLRSGTAGLPFELRPGNVLNGAEGTFLDATFVLPLQIVGDLPLELVNRWNGGRRFGRLHLSQGFLVLEMDISVAGGAGREHLKITIEIWDRLVSELAAWLGAEVPKLAVANGAAPPSPVEVSAGAAAA